MSERLFSIVPYVDLPEMTAQAVDDILAQEGVRTEVLLISNGSSPDTRKQIEARAKEWGSRVHTWFHHPPLLTLNATWNAALDFCWQAGAEVAWVVNNDVRLHPSTAGHLLAAITHATGSDLAMPLFVSAVGVRPTLPDPYEISSTRGGPDFSCYLISKECHLKYRFDENFTYMGDNDLHRQIMLGGDGARIFSVNVPYLHFGSQTINKATPEQQSRYRLTFASHQEIYAAKWGGPVNGERYRIPFDESSAEEGITNPELQAKG